MKLRIIVIYMHMNNFCMNILIEIDLEHTFLV